MRVSTLMVSPSLMKSGTDTTAPVSTVAGLEPPDTVLPLTLGEVATIWGRGAGRGNRACVVRAEHHVCVCVQSSRLLGLQSVGHLQPSCRADCRVHLQRRSVRVRLAQRSEPVSKTPAPCVTMCLAAHCRFSRESRMCHKPITHAPPPHTPLQHAAALTGGACGRQPPPLPLLLLSRVSSFLLGKPPRPPSLAPSLPPSLPSSLPP